jgi:hypothetical protein
MKLLHDCDTETSLFKELEEANRRYEREKQARLHAETLLQQKTLELFHTNQKLAMPSIQPKKNTVASSKTWNLACWKWILWVLS